jgi:ribonuclease-3
MRPRTRSVRSAISRSFRTACVRTAGTTPAARLWRPSDHHGTDGEQTQRESVLGVPRKSSPLERALGVRFKDESIRETALTHRSFAFEQGALTTNERLEFLGDAVLGLVVTDIAFRSFPDLSEGELAKLRAAVVNMTTLAEVARELQLGEAILLGRGEELSGGRNKASILADAFEAVLGAVYVDRGLRVAVDLIRRLFWPRMAAYVRGEGDRDYKTILQELAAQDVGRLPEYRVEERGPDHEKEFTATVYLGGQQFGRGTGRSKKEAEQRAAREAYARFTTGQAEMAKEH